MAPCYLDRRFKRRLQPQRPLRPKRDVLSAVKGRVLFVTKSRCRGFPRCSQWARSATTSRPQKSTGHFPSPSLTTTCNLERGPESQNPLFPTKSTFSGAWQAGGSSPPCMVPGWGEELVQKLAKASLPLPSPWDSATLWQPVLKYLGLPHADPKDLFHQTRWLNHLGNRVGFY